MLGDLDSIFSKISETSGSYYVALVFAVILGLAKFRKEYLDGEFRKMKEYSDRLEAQVDECQQHLDACMGRVNALIKIEADLQNSLAKRDAVGAKLAAKCGEDWATLTKVNSDEKERNME